MAEEKKDEIEIEIVEDTNTSVDVTPTPEKKDGAAPAVVPSADEAVEQLKAQLGAEKGRADRAEAQVRNADAAVNNAETARRQSELQTVTTAIEALKATETTLKGSFAAAMAAGDFDKVAEIQTEMGKNSAKLVQLESGKDAMEAEAKNPIRRVERTADPVEQLASQLSPRSAQWVRSHPECATNPRMYQRMLAGHNLALTEGLTADTDPYFARVEEIIGIKTPKVDTTKVDTASPLSEAAGAAKPRDSGPPPAAPPSRSGNGAGTQPGRVRLTRAEVEMAEAMGMTPSDYAKNKEALKKEGKLN